jgi:hypothetical protein
MDVGLLEITIGDYSAILLEQIRNFNARFNLLLVELGLQTCSLQFELLGGEFSNWIS